MSITRRCAVRLQDSQANCGPTALRNALLALGISRSNDELETLCGTSATDGTTARALSNAVGTIDGCLGNRIEDSRSDVALLRLWHTLDRGRPVLLLVDSWNHWVAAIGLLNDRYLIADSADNELVISLTAAELLTRWRCATTRRQFYGIVV